MWEPVSGLVSLVAQTGGAGDANVAPFLAILISGFALAAYGHAAKNRWLIGIGIAMVLLAAILFQLEIRATSPDDRLPIPV